MKLALLATRVGQDRARNHSRISGQCQNRRAIALLAVLVGVVSAAQAAELKAPDFVGAWCLTQSVQNGHGEPRSNFYERRADCPAEDLVFLGPHSLDGLQWGGGKDHLHVEGQPKPEAPR